MYIELKSILNKKPFKFYYKNFLLSLFKEDRTQNDLTTKYIATNPKKVEAKIIAKEKGILAGLEIIKNVFFIEDKSIKFFSDYEDGMLVKPHDIICTLKGPTTSILQSERIALNLLQRLSGVASEASSLVALLKGTKTHLLDTRKTTPGMRYFEKYATTVGGALNHRLNLADGILIKENHIMVAGSISKAVNIAYEKKLKNILIEVEVKNLEEVKEAVNLPVDVIMLDNFSLANTRKAIKIINGRKKVEASGNVNLKTIQAIANTGVDYISVGAMTHSAHSLDFSLLIYDEFYD